MPDVLRASGPRDLLAYVPSALGFQPRDSLVLVALDGRRVGPVLRQDLPPAADRGTVRQLVAGLAAFAARVEPRSVLAVAYSDARLPRRLVEVLRHALDLHGIALDDAWHVGGGRYRCLTCTGSCCPADGRPVRELESSLVLAELVLRGRAPVADRSELAGDLSPLPAAEQPVVAAAAAEEALRLTDGRSPARSRLGALACWRSALADWPTLPEPRVTGRLVAAVADVRVRDAVMLTAVPGSGTVPDRMAAGVLDAEVARCLDHVFGVVSGDRCDGEGPARPGPVPDDDLARAAEGVLRHVARGAAGTRGAAAPLSLLAWLAWWCGDGARAWVYVDHALAADPAYSLALLLATVLERALGPGWTRAGRRDAGLLGPDRETSGPRGGWQT
jgi:hypothetical protein